jgi:hypothetical protein
MRAKSGRRVSSLSIRKKSAHHLALVLAREVKSRYAEEGASSYDLSHAQPLPLLRGRNG